MELNITRASRVFAITLHHSVVRLRRLSCRSSKNRPSATSLLLKRISQQTHYCIQTKQTIDFSIRCLALQWKSAHVLCSNSRRFVLLRRYAAAAERSTALKHNWAKAYSRLGAVHLGFDDASRTMESTRKDHKTLLGVRRVLLQSQFGDRSAESTRKVNRPDLTCTQSVCSNRLISVINIYKRANQKK